MKIEIKEFLVFLRDHRYRIHIILVITIYTYFFLLIFEPFEVHLIENKFIELVGYSFMSLLVVSLYWLFIPKYILRKKRIKSILLNPLYLILIIITIGFFDFLLASFILKNYSFSLINFLKFQYYSFTISLFPTIILYLIFKISQSKKISQDELKEKEKLEMKLKMMETQISIKSEKILIKNQTKENTHLFLTNDLILFEAMGNYVNVHFKEKNATNSLMIRNTLSNIENYLSDHNTFLRCHRSFIVNIQHIDKLIGKGRNKKIVLKQLDKEVPITRTKIQQILQFLKDHTSG